MRTRIIEPPNRIAPAVCLLATIALLLGLLPAVPASAGVVTNQRPFLFAFDGSDTTAGRFEKTLNSIAVDNSNGTVYVSEDTPEFLQIQQVSKFSANGSATTFSSIAVSSLFGAGVNVFSNDLGIAVDNSEGINQGQLYISQGGGRTRLNIFNSNGAHLCTQLPITGIFSDVTVDVAGHPWTAGDINPADPSPVHQLANAGCSRPIVGSPPAGAGGVDVIDLDADGSIYLGRSGEIEKWVGGVLHSVLDPSGTDVYVDQSSLAGHIFTVDGNDFQEFDSSGALLGTQGTDYITAILAHQAPSIAYNPALDRVYVVQQASFSDPAPIAAAFGPPQSGVVPDLTIDPVSGVEVGNADFAGMVDPQGQGGTYRFEWRRTTTSWAAASVATVPTHVAGISPPQPLPAGPGAVPVSFKAEAKLRGNTEYEVRLVTVNAGSGLRSVSAAQGFKTQIASASPSAEVSVIDGVGTTGATVKGTIHPQSDFVEWKVQRSTDPSCTSSFEDAGPVQELAPAAGPVSVSTAISGLLPSQRYCVRIVASNSAGKVNSATEEFETNPVAPDEVETAFVAPRGDTSVRLNGRADPKGHELTYSFEWSADGGTTWESLPEQTNESEAREKIVVGQELEGIEPQTTYLYRFIAENPAGTVQSEAKSFTTRLESTEPACPNTDVRAKQHTVYLPDCRAVELVNEPDKGNQDAYGGLGETLPATSDGDSALWRIDGASPGSYLTANNNFVADRTATGWMSTTVAVPTDIQLGEEYTVMAATPDFSRMVVRARQVGDAAVVVRLDRAQNQEILRSYPSGIIADNVDLTGDGAHVVVKNPETGQVEDIGSGEPAEVLSIQPDGQPSKCKAGVFPDPTNHWIATTDASRVFFEAKPNSSCAALTALYLRNRDTEQTTLIDPGSSATLTAPKFIRATPDGRAGYFLTHSKLDPADENEGGDVYRWDEEAGESTCLTCEAHPNVNLSYEGSFFEVLVSDDFSHVYFESEEKLTPQATPGHSSIYALSEEEIRFVADTDNGEGTLNQGKPRLSEDGDVLVFRAAAKLGLTADPVKAGTSQVYRYDDTDGSLECLSCRQDALTSSAAADHEISGDGSIVAFETAEPLVPLDVNQGSDVYRWRESTVALITDGVSDYPQVPDVIGLDSNGSDLFFRAVDPGLTGFEQDGVANFYDAREGGGFDPPTPPAHCTEDSCQGPLQAAPPTDRPATSGYSGPGNVPGPTAKPRPCAKKRGKAKRRCIRKNRERAARAKQGRMR